MQNPTILADSPPDDYVDATIKEFNMLKDDFIPYFKPTIGEEEERDVLECLRSGWLTTGKYAKAFEKDFAEFLGVKHAVALNSCTAALHLALEAVGIGPGDIVLVPTLTFTATAEVVRYFDAIPLMIDSNENDFCMDMSAARRALEAIAKGAPLPGLPTEYPQRQAKAIIPVHFGGTVADLDALAELKADFGIHVVEDCAHVLPAWRTGADGNKVLAGSTADIACFSFYANKTITTGEGGMLATNNAEFADRARIMSLHGISKDAWKRYAKGGAWRYEVVAPGFKYNMPDLAAAVGVNQLKRANQFREGRAKVAAGYENRLADIPGLILPKQPENVIHSWHLYVVRINAAEFGTNRDEFIEKMRELGIGTSVHFIPLHLQPYYRETFAYKAGDLPVAERLFKEIVSLPIYPFLSESNLNRVADAIHKIATNKV